MSKNISKFIFLIQLMLLPTVSSVSAQNHVPEVTNVDFQQRTDFSLLADIYYDVYDAGGDSMIVTMIASSDSGETWNLTCNNISGAVGNGITSGTGKHIVWNIGAEHPNFFSNKVMIEIVAEDGITSPPVLVLPENNTVIISVSPTLVWNASASAISYTLQVSESNSFISCVYNQSGLTGTSQMVNGLNDSATYYWRVSATNIYGTSEFSTTWSFSIAPQPCPGLPTVTYYDKTYNTVQIGTQCWLKENLDVGIMINSSTLADSMRNNGLIEKYCYENNQENCTTYGGFYLWNEAMQYSTTPGTQGICPPGWHIPTRAEFQTLRIAVNIDGNTLKAIGQGSNVPPFFGGGTNTSGFSGLLSGIRNNLALFVNLGYITFFWSSTEYDSHEVYYMGLLYNANYIYLSNYEKDHSYSVRCLKDN